VGAWIQKIIAFFDRDLTRLEHQATSRWGRLGLRQLRITIYVGKRLVLGRHTERAGALTYLSLLSIIPLLAVVFSLFKAFGGFADLERQAQGFLLNYIPNSSEQVAQWLDGFIRGFNAGAVGVIGMATLLVTVILTLSAVENALNQTWSVRKPRGWGMRLVVYWSLLTVGPLLLGASLAFTATVQAQSGVFNWMSENIPLFGLVKALVPVLVTSLAFTALYAVLPSTRVRLGAAWTGGVSAAILFEVAKTAYAAYTAKSVASSTLYGSLAAFPVFVVWVNYSWRFVLFGADIVHATQHSSTDPTEETDPRTNQATREEAAVRMCGLIAGAFAKQERPPSVEDLTHRLYLPAHLVDVLAAHLLDAGLLRESGSGLLPSKPLEALSVADIVHAMRHKVGVAHWSTADDQDDAIDRLLLDCESASVEKYRAVPWTDLFEQRKS
jgi:membrane protein